MNTRFARSKKILSLLLCGMLALNGCGAEQSTDSSGNSTESTGEKITLTMWHYYNGNTKDMIDDLIMEFNETAGAAQNVYVDAYSYGSVNDLATTLVSSAKKEVGADDMPDIFLAYSDNALLLDDFGIVANMDDYFSADELALYRSDFLDEGRFDNEGNLKIIPIAKSTEILFINDSDFSVFAEVNGVDYADLATWEGLAEVAEVYYNWTDAQTEEANDGKALFGLDSEANFALIASKQLSEEIYDYNAENITFGLSEEGAKRIWDSYIVPHIKGHFVRYGSFRSDDVKSGDLLMYAGSTSSSYYFPSVVELGRTESYDIEGVTLPYPYFDGGEQYVVQQGAGIVVSKSTYAKESAAAEFIKWFTSAENNLEFAASTGYIPVQNDALEYDVVISVMDDTNDSEIPQIVSNSIDTTYNVLLPEYTFYSNKPFIGSYDSRYAIAEYFASTVAQYGGEYQGLLDDGMSVEEAAEIVTGDEYFSVWYTELKTTVNDILANQ